MSICKHFVLKTIVTFGCISASVSNKLFKLPLDIELIHSPGLPE